MTDPGRYQVLLARFDAWITAVEQLGAANIERFPDCGCDACDSGSQDLLGYLDEYLLSITTGKFRLLNRRSQIVVTLTDGRGGARGLPELLDMGDVLVDPRGFLELTGPSWLE